MNIYGSSRIFIISYWTKAEWIWQIPDAASWVMKVSSQWVLSYSWSMSSVTYLSCTLSWQWLPQEGYKIYAWLPQEGYKIYAWLPQEVYEIWCLDLTKSNGNHHRIKRVTYMYTASAILQQLTLGHLLKIWLIDYPYQCTKSSISSFGYLQKCRSYPWGHCIFWTKKFSVSFNMNMQSKHDHVHDV